jgi:hypothetical protein
MIEVTERHVCSGLRDVLLMDQACRIQPLITRPTNVKVHLTVTKGPYHVEGPGMFLGSSMFSGRNRLRKLSVWLKVSYRINYITISSVALWRTLPICRAVMLPRTYPTGRVPFSIHVNNMITLHPSIRRSCAKLQPQYRAYVPSH